MMAPTSYKPQLSMAEVDRLLVTAGPGTHFELDEAVIHGRKQLIWKNVSDPPGLFQGAPLTRHSNREISGASSSSDCGCLPTDSC